MNQKNHTNLLPFGSNVQLQPNSPEPNTHARCSTNRLLAYLLFLQFVIKSQRILRLSSHKITPGNGTPSPNRNFIQILHFKEIRQSLFVLTVFSHTLSDLRQHMQVFRLHLFYHTEIIDCRLIISNTLTALRQML